MSKHSPLPWRKSAEKLSLYDKDGFCVGCVFADDNAELIVAAVNSYDSLRSINKELVEALENTLRMLGLFVDFTGDDIASACKAQADAVLTRAKSLT